MHRESYASPARNPTKTLYAPGGPISTVGIARTQYSVKVIVIVEKRGLLDAAIAVMKPVVKPVIKPERPGTPNTYVRVAPSKKFITNSIAPKPPLRTK
jgi:hypothetical protein